MGQSFTCCASSYIASSCVIHWLVELLMVHHHASVIDMLSFFKICIIRQSLSDWHSSNIASTCDSPCHVELFLYCIILRQSLLCWPSNIPYHASVIVCWASSNIATLCIIQFHVKLLITHSMRWSLGSCSFMLVF